jgi:hypothetical protein
MRHTIWTGTCAALVTFATAGILAQTTAQPPTPPPTPQTATASADKITVTGCLKAAPQAATDTAAAATTAGTSGTTTAGTTGTTGTTATTATGTTGAAPAAAPAATDAKFVLTDATATPADAGKSTQTYRLIANPTALTAHIGKKLELTGTIDATSTADPKDPSASAPALRVESGKVLAASCTQ